MLRPSSHNPNETLTPEDAAELARLADAFEEMVRLARAATTYGDIVALDKFVDSIDADVE